MFTLTRVLSLHVHNNMLFACTYTCVCCMCSLHVFILVFAVCAFCVYLLYTLVVFACWLVKSTRFIGLLAWKNIRCIDLFAWKNICLSSFLAWKNIRCCRNVMKEYVLYLLVGSQRIRVLFTFWLEKRTRAPRTWALNNELHRSILRALFPLIGHKLPLTLEMCHMESLRGLSVA